MDRLDFLPVSKEDMQSRGWWWYDVLLVTGDAYVDHPSFGTAVIGRVLEREGYRVAVLAQPDWHSAEAFAAMGRPRLCVMIGSGNLDSMVAHYTAARRRRSEDFYSPRQEGGSEARPGGHRLRQPGARGISGPYGHYRRAGGFPSPLCPLRLLGRRGPCKRACGLGR